MRTNIVFIFILLLLCGVHAKAHTRLNPDFHHFVSMDGALGYSSLLNNSDSVAAGAGPSLQVGVGYRLLYNDFLFATGAEFYYLYNQYSMSGAKLDLKMWDTEADPFVYHVDATAGKDRVHSVSINIPVLFGAEYKRFYFLAGPKISLNVWNQMYAQANMVTTAEYGKYIDIFENMPNHMLGKYDIESEKCRANWSLDVLAHFEIGARLGAVSFETGADVEKPKHRIYLAVYADYGLLNLNRATAEGNRLGYEQEAGKQLQLYLTPALMSNELSGVRVNQLSVGIKTTVLLELSTPKKCVTCEY